MEKGIKQKINLGLFVITGTTLFVAAIYLIGQKQNLFKTTIALNAFFQNVNGLQEGSNVRYSGINVGIVQHIKMENDSTIKVVMGIEKEITNHIKKNAIATIGSDGLVGNKIVNIVPGKRDVTTIKDGDFIKSYSKISTDDLLNTLGVSTENTAILTADLLKITSAITKGKGPLHTILYDTLMAKNLQQSMANLNTMSSSAVGSLDELKQIVESLKDNNKTLLGILLNDTLSGEKLKTTIDHLEKSSNTIENTLEKLSGMVNETQSSKGALNYFTKDTALVKTLKNTLENIQLGTDNFNQNMEALKHSFLTRGYFRKLEREKKKNKN